MHAYLKACPMLKKLAYLDLYMKYESSALNMETILHMESIDNTELLHLINTLCANHNKSRLICNLLKCYRSL